MKPWIVFIHPTSDDCITALNLLDKLEIPYKLYHDYGHISGLLVDFGITRTDLPLIFVNGELGNYLVGLEALTRHLDYHGLKV